MIHVVLKCFLMSYDWFCVSEDDRFIIDGSSYFCNTLAYLRNLVIYIIFYILYFFLEREKADKLVAKHKRQLTTWQVFFVK